VLEVDEVSSGHLISRFWRRAEIGSESKDMATKAVENEVLMLSAIR